jgi:hypothetical protein
VPGPRLVQTRSPLGESSDVIVPGGDGVRLVEAHAERDLLPEALHVRLAEHLLRPSLARGAGAAPVHGVPGQELQLELDELLRHGPPHALTVQVGHQVRLRIARRRDHRVAVQRGDELLQPRGRIRQRLVRSELDHRLPRVRVVVEDVNVRGVGAVGLAREGSREIVMFDGREEEDLLARLDVRAHPDDELGVALEAFVHRKDPMQKST